MSSSNIKKPAPCRNHAEKLAADFEPIFKSLAASKVIMGIAPKLVGAQLVDTNRLVVAHRSSQAQKAAADFKKLTGHLNAARSHLKNRGGA